MYNGKYLDPASVVKEKLKLVAPELEVDPVRLKELNDLKAYIDLKDDATNTNLQKGLEGLSIKTPCRAATVANIVLSGTQTVDDVVLNPTERVLVKEQNNPTENGIYVVDVGNWTRAADANTTEELVSGTFVMVKEGTANKDTGFSLITDNITLGTTPLKFEVLNLMKNAVPFKGNVGMVALETHVDGDMACATGLLKKPALKGCVSVFVSGLRASLGDGQKNKACYFSNDQGVTAKNIDALDVGDKLYWNGSLVKVQLDPTDIIDIEYNA